MKIKLASTGELIKRLNQSSNQQDVKLTFADKKIYIKLIEYADTHGEYDKQSLFIRESESSIAKIAGYSARTVQDTLKKLVTSRVISRKHGEHLTDTIITIFKLEYIQGD